MMSCDVLCGHVNCVYVKGRTKRTYLLFNRFPAFVLLEDCCFTADWCSFVFRQVSFFFPDVVEA